MRLSNPVPFLLIGLSGHIQLHPGELTVEAIFGDLKFESNLPKGLTWRPDHDELTYYEKDEKTDVLFLKSLDARTGEESVLLTSKTVDVFQSERSEKRFTLSNFIWSPDGKSLLIPGESDLYLYRPENQQLRRLTNHGAEARDPVFSFDGAMIAYIKNNNLQSLDLETGRVRFLTTTGSETRLIGRFDWVYEEEFDIRTGFFWSPDSRYIAFFESDIRNEPSFPIVDFIPVLNEVETMRYPKAGAPNAVVRIGIVQVATGRVRFLNLGKETDCYIPRIAWLPDSRTLAIQRLNRAQNRLDLLFADIGKGSVRSVLTEKDPDGWVDVFEGPEFLRTRDRFVWISERDNRAHLYLYENDGNLIRQITQGPWDVTEIVHVDEKENQVYFMGTLENSRERHLYQIRMAGGPPEKLTKKPGTHDIKISASGQFFADTFSSVTTPPCIALCNKHGGVVQSIANGQIDALEGYDLAEPTFFTLKTEDGLHLNAMFLKPANFDKTKTYPVLMYVYGGPGSQIVANSWRRGQGNLWHQLLLQRGYLIFSVDNRGTGLKGNDFKNRVYLNMSLGLQDQIAAANHLKKLEFVDPDRIGIWGWSGGGWMTAMAMTRGAPVFKAGIAVAMVSDFRNYDTIWTERYMGQPEDNPGGYDACNPATHIDNYQSGLLIVHGTADDNVHLSNAMQFIYKLQNARKPFDMMLYPRKLHGISGRDTRVHLYNTLTDFIMEHL